jgi:hypothetical protein
MSLLDKTRDEILETQKMQASFARWKLLLVATLGAAGLGVVPNEPNGRGAALLSLLPLVCVYADTLIYNSGIRILAIARYLRVDAKGNFPGHTDTSEDASDELPAVRDYERFFKENRPHFNLEVVALQGVTSVVSLIVFLIGLTNLGVYRWNWKPLSIGVIRLNSGDEAVLLIVSSLLGLALSWILWFRHDRKSKFFDRN